MTFGMKLIDAMKQERESVLMVLRDADANGFHDYISGFEQAGRDMEKVVMKQLQAFTQLAGECGGDADRAIAAANANATPARQSPQ